MDVGGIESDAFDWILVYRGPRRGPMDGWMDAGGTETDDFDWAPAVGKFERFFVGRRDDLGARRGSMAGWMPGESTRIFSVFGFGRRDDVDAWRGQMDGWMHAMRGVMNLVLFIFFALDYTWRSVGGGARTELFDGYNGTIFAYGQVRVGARE